MHCDYLPGYVLLDACGMHIAACTLANVTVWLLESPAPLQDQSVCFACYPEHATCRAEGMDATSGGAETQKDDEDYGDGGYHEAFQEYCLYGRKRYLLSHLIVHAYTY